MSESQLLPNEDDMRILSGAGLTLLVFICGTPRTAHADVNVLRVVGEAVHCMTGAQSCYVQADCPSGFGAIGGGISGDQIKIEASYSYFVGWLGTFRGARREYGSGAHAIARAFALCAAAIPGTSVQGPQTLCPTGQGSCSSVLSCPAGTNVISGGMSGQQSEMESSSPFNNGAWQMKWYPDGEDFASTALGSSIPYAACADASVGMPVYVFGESTRCLHDGPSCQSTVSCPAGMVLVAGGFNGTQSKVESMAPYSAETWFVSWYPAGYEYGSSALAYGAAVGVCMPGTSNVDPIFANSFET